MMRHPGFSPGRFCAAVAALALLFTAGSFAARASFPKPYNSERDTSSTPLPPHEAAAAIALPPGFRASVFAAEPDVSNPIALTWDARGRLWIAENYTYAENTLKFDLRLRDRILVFDGARGGDRFTSRQVFVDDIQRLTSIEVGHGGVWAMCLPQLLFIPDRDGDGVADGPAEVVLDGFEISPDHHHTGANGLRFGPDGWLYGRCGASSVGEIGAPGTPQDARVPLRGTMWRYHPQRKIVEVLSAGTTNPYGHDWNEHGELFFINTVNGHLWHGITGAHYKRPHTLDPNPAVYALIDHHADHWHFDTGQGWTKSRDGAANTQGGGHAHVGMMIYQGDNFPAAYRGRLFTLNFHGRRANQEFLERAGSGYVGRHGPDFFVSGDRWFRGQEISSGPDGGVFVLDWSDTGECHESTGVHRESGRVFKITHGEPRPPAHGDLRQLAAGALAALHTHANDWFVRQARLELAARAAAGQRLDEAEAKLRGLYQGADVVVSLRSLWTLHAMGAADSAFLRAQLRHKSEHVRTWAIRLLSDEWPLDTVMSRRPARAESAPSAELLAGFHRLAATDPSGLVRLALGSVLQRLPHEHRPALAGALVGRAEDASDHNLPLLVWYGLIPLAETDPHGLVNEVAARCELPQTREFIARRLAEDLETNPVALNELLHLAVAKPPAFHADIAAGIAAGLKGWRRAAKPEAWDAFAAAAATDAARAHVRELAVLFGDGRALDELRRVALDPKAELPARRIALRSLIETRAPDLRQVCEQVLGIRSLNTIAVQGLARFDDPAIGTRIARSYRQFAPEDREGVITTLIARPAFARALLAEVVAGRIPRSALTAYHARQIRAFGDEALNRELADAWGDAREPAADKRTFIEELKAELTPDILAAADKGRGRIVYANVCASCHTLHGQGGRIGPDLTGSGRDNLDYLLEHTVDPSAVVTADFRLQVITLRDGRTLSGFVSEKTARTLTLNTTAETLTIENADIVSRQEFPQSLMPEGILEALSLDDVRALIAYLMHPTQVPLPPQ